MKIIRTPEGQYQDIAFPSPTLFCYFSSCQQFINNAESRELAHDFIINVIYYF